MDARRSGRTISASRFGAATSGEPLSDKGLIEARVPVPADIADIRLKDPGAARQIQAKMGEQFNHYFGKGWAVTGFEKNDTEGAYLLSVWPSK